MFIYYNYNHNLINIFIAIITTVTATATTTTASITTTATNNQCRRNTINLGHIINALLNDYDIHLLPSNEGVNVTIEMHVQGITAISELTGDFELDFMYSEIWEDQRLNFKQLNICATNITLKGEFRKRIWTPETCIINSRHSSIHTSPSENTFIILYENGIVWSNFRLKVRAPCKMDLRMFPFDSIICKLTFESYSFNADEVRLFWHEKPLTMMEIVELPDFELIGWRTDHERSQYPNGEWDRAMVEFKFARRYGFYLFQSYFPTSLTVISSWVGFFFDVRAASAKITLGVSSLLAVSFQFGSVLRHLPRASYIKCLDVWMISSIIFIFCTLVELAIICRLNHCEREKQIGSHAVNQWINQIRKRKNLNGNSSDSNVKVLRRQNISSIVNLEKLRKAGNATTDIDITSDNKENTSNEHRFFKWPIIDIRKLLVQLRDRDWTITAAQVDYYSMRLFPLSFLLFNIIYWTVYISKMDGAF